MNRPKSLTPNPHAGFSLLELLLYTGILAVVVSVIGTIYVDMAKSQSVLNARSEVNSALRFSLEKITQDIRSATSVATPAATTSSASTLVLTAGGVQVSYCIDSGVLRRQEVSACNASSPALTSSKVTVNSLTVWRRQNYNSVLAKSYISITPELSVSANASDPAKIYTQTRSVTAQLR